MKTTILAFGIVKELFNDKQIEMVFEKEITVGELRKELASRYPEIKKLRSYLIAVNDEYAEDALILKSTDEIAVIPPVSGG